jgi:hypothetical protein
MEYNNEALAEAIVKSDPTAEWVYNKYCPYCGKFLYPEETSNCKKCKSPADKPVKRVIPFLTSAVAIEKLLLWVRDNKKDTQLLENVVSIIGTWTQSRRSAETYKLEIVIACVNALLDTND